MDNVTTDHNQLTASDRVSEAGHMQGNADLRCCYQCSWGRAYSTSSGDRVRLRTFSSTQTWFAPILWKTSPTNLNLISLFESKRFFKRFV